MNIVTAVSQEEWTRPFIGDPCRDIHACRVMLSIVNHIMNNYEVVLDA